MPSDAMATENQQIRVFSLNCWGLKFVAKNRIERVAAIAKYLTNTPYDVVTLQELWVYADYEHVRDSVQAKLPHAKFFYSGALGAGLAIFSRFPIVASHIHPYSLNGSPIDVSAGDWFVGKAAASVIIQHPILNEVQIFNTHLFAKGGEAEAHRYVNAWELAKLILQAAELGRYVIAPGDYNSIPTTLPMTIIKDYAGLSDAWSVTHPNTFSNTPPNRNSSTSPPDPAVEAITKYGVTADSPLCTYSAGKPLDGHALQFCGKRLDYILFRHPHPQSINRTEKRNAIVCTHCKVVLTECVPEYDFSYSDHFGLEATFTIQPAEGGIYADPAPSLSRAAVLNTIQSLTNCWRLSAQRSRKELIMFGMCIFALVAIAVGTAWLPHSWINPIFIIVTVAISWWGTTMLYQGFLYGNWERNALQNIIEELEIYSKGLDTQSRISRSA
ncbi:inositol phosphophingolipids phospholipase C [Pleurotus eryngii]|uniref:Inositol phosphophingolipids phospholipase C n=1 Tax=Pleurotus eryngii TaxID=5323 RepID=A0A9P6A969_PLEER|nr:inositol phosphophingolipids phospholipase C [Pleurotus eryngii]